MLAKMLSGAGGNAARPQPTFVSSSINRVAASSNTIPAPSGIQDGDLLIIVGFATGGNSTITFPSGFTGVYYDGSGTNTQFAGVKVAASESGSYVIGSSNPNTAAILVYRNATRINTVGAATKATSATSTASGITPTYAGVVCAVFGHGGNGTVVTPPSGLTQRALFANSSLNPGLGVYELANPGPSATSTYSLVWSLGNPNAGFQFQVTNEPSVAPEFVAGASTQLTSQGNSVVIGKPSGTLEGDLMVLTANAGSNSPNLSAPAGWTTIADGGGATPSTLVAYKVAGASEPASYTVTTGKTQLLAGAILSYRYAAYDTVAAALTTATNPLVLSSISPSLSQSVLIAIAARGAAGITITAPTGMSAKVTDADANAPSYVVCDQTVAKGPTGTRSMSTGSTNNVAGIMLAIKPTRSLA